jgi:hypothetical protein
MTRAKRLKVFKHKSCQKVNPSPTARVKGDMKGSKFLGLDLRTQSLTALVIDPSEWSIAFQASFTFDETYPSYQTRGGVRVAQNPKVVRADPRMWVEALDDMLDLPAQKGVHKANLRHKAFQGDRQGRILGMNSKSLF